MVAGAHGEPELAQAVEDSLKNSLTGMLEGKREGVSQSKWVALDVVLVVDKTAMQQLVRGATDTVVFETVRQEDGMD
jgi:hypothetical protein